MKALVTGGTGFLGNALARKLKSLGFEVHTVARRKALDLESMGISHHQVDIQDQEALSALMKGIDVVFHTAAKVGMWGKYKDFYNINFLGTKNLLDIAKKAGVKSFIYTSSPSVVANGKDLVFVDETQEYPEHYNAHYPKTKAMAERLVLDSNDDQMHTCSLRPHLIWGPGDTNLIPTICERASKGKLLQIGNGQNKVDVTFIEDCVDAHICALNGLKDNPKARGQAYFISQGEPVYLWKWVNEVLRAKGIPEVKKTLPFSVAISIAKVAEFITRVTFSKKEPLLTAFLVEEMSTDHYFNITKAKDLLGFEPKNSIAEGMGKTF